MKESLFPAGTAPQVIKDNLLAMCYGSKTEVYQKPLTEEEVTKLEKEFIQNNVKFAKLTDDFNKVKDDFKNKMKPVEALMKEEIKILKTKSIETEGTVYEIDDQENRMMSVYDDRGILLYSRPLTSGERQLHINKAAANE
jgi:hypothetical protein